MRAKGRNSLTTRADKYQVALCRRLASFRDPVISALGWTDDQATQHPLAVASFRSALWIVATRRPELLGGDLWELAREASHLVESLLEGVDDADPWDLTMVGRGKR